jgi:hypothetical protein
VERQLDLFAGPERAAEKVCKKCGIPKSLTEFPIANGCKDGRRGDCKACRRAYEDAWNSRERIRRSEERRRKAEAAPAVTAKPCRKCGTVKPLDAFYRSKAGKHGRKSTCIECDRAKRSTPEYREVHKVYSRRYRHSEKGQEKYHEYYRSDAGQAAHRRYHKSERRRRWRKGYRASGMEKIVYDKWSKGEKGKTWRHRTRTTPEFRARMKVYRSRPEVRRRLCARAIVSQHKRDARMRGLEASLTRYQWQAALRHFDRCCAYCGSREKMTRDHFVPLVLGGPFTRANVVPACLSCNSRKRCSPPEQWCAPDVYAKVKAYLDQFA